MKLDRNLDSTGTGKYALLRLRRLHDATANLPMEVTAAIQLLDDHGLIEWGLKGTPGEFFPIMLKDRNAQHALTAYANSVHARDPEFAGEVYQLSNRAGECSPFCKDPD